MTDSKMKSTKNHKKEDGTFHSKHIKHNPQAESARAVFGLKDNNVKSHSNDSNTSGNSDTGSTSNTGSSKR
jgi:hypothetical protein